MEIKILDMIQNLHTTVGDHFFIGITKLGDAGIIWIFLTILLLILPKMRKYGLAMLVGLCIDVIVCNGLLKNLVARTRPCDVNTAIQLLISHPTDYSFPSGHTAASFTAVAALYFSGNKKIWKAAIVLGILIAFSRMYLYVHYPTDILGGILVGIFSGFIGSKIVTSLEKYHDNGGGFSGCIWQQYYFAENRCV